MSAQALAPWVARASLTIVVALGLSAPFVLDAPQALWMSPLLIAAAAGGWLGWRIHASDRRAEAHGAAPTPVAGTVEDPRLNELQGELEMVAGNAFVIDGAAPSLRSTRGRGVLKCAGA